MIESSFSDDCGQLRCYAITLVTFIYHNSPAGLLSGGNQRLFIQRVRSAWINDFRADTQLCQFLRRGESNLDHAAGSHQCDISSRAFDVRNPERDGIIALWYGTL